VDQTATREDARQVDPQWYWTALGVAAITAFGFFVLPGHTYLQSDTQIYGPVIEWLRDPSLFRNDLIPRGAHVSLTIYDETARVLAGLLGSLQAALQVQQLLFRAVGVWGIFLIATGCGLKRWPALAVAWGCSLGATIIGPAVLTVEYEPVPRGFAIGLITLSLGLIAHRRWWWAGAAASLALLYHAPAVWPFWLAVLFLPQRRAFLIPLIPAVGMLLLLAQPQSAIAEKQHLFSVLTADHAELQRMRASYNWISLWFGRFWWYYVLAWGVGLAADVRLRRVLPGPVRLMLLAMPVVGLLSVPFSYLTLEKLQLALMPQLQPMRALLFTILCPLILAAIAAFQARAWWARIFWMSLVLYSPFVHVKPSWDKLLSGTVNFPRIETAPLRQLADWAQSETERDAVFLFPDEGRSLPPGVFRVRALRAVYVDWKAGGQVNYFPLYAREWWRRWRTAMEPKFTPARVPVLAGMGIDYLVLSRSALPGVAPAWSNSVYRVYRIR
jgi:MFS family permease